MASLDNLEGDAIEGAVLLVIVVVIVLAWSLYKASTGAASAWAEFAKKLLKMFADLADKAHDFSMKARDSLYTDPGAVSGYGPDQVVTGTSNSADQLNPAITVDSTVDLGGYGG